MVGCCAARFSSDSSSISPAFRKLGPAKGGGYLPEFQRGGNLYSCTAEHQCSLAGALSADAFVIIWSIAPTLCFRLNEGQALTGARERVMHLIGWALIAVFVVVVVAIGIALINWMSRSKRDTREPSE